MASPILPSGKHILVLDDGAGKTAKVDFFGIILFLFSFSYP